jgi:hypothetical protein
MEVAKKHQDYLERIKTNVRRAHDYFKPNYDRYNEFRRFVFDTSLKEEEVTLLMTLSKPQLEFNVLEAYISRLLGEFSKQEPSIAVSADDEKNADPLTISVVEQHLRHALFDSKNHHTKYEVYKDLLSGGFSVFKVWTDYANRMSFDQVINFDRAFDPTLCGFDQLARYSHKGDGRFCFELFPMEKERFIEDYPDVDITKVSFRRDFAGFNWSYLNDNTEILIVGDYYEKKIKHTKIVKLNNGQTMTMKEYEAMAESWNDFSMMPSVVGKPRMTDFETISRYRVIENQVLEYRSTDMSMFPLVFVDGNSVMIKTPKNGNVRQMTRPYVYHAKSAQRLKNYAGIALANEIENMVQHKFIIKKEALPKEEDLLQAIKDIQKPSNVIINAFYEENPNMPIPEPIREIAKIPAPPEVLQGFQTTDGLIQNILGSYDASLGINNNQLSGMAIVEAASQSNAAAMPYIVGFLQGLQRVAEIIVDLIPKYYTTPRTLPIQDPEGKKHYIKINQEGGVPLEYDENALNVKVEAGVNFQVQKSRALQQIISLMQASPLFSQFMNSRGLKVLLDNIDIRGIDQIKIMAEDWMKEMQQQQQQQMQQQAAQNNPLVERNKLLEKQLELGAQKSQNEFMVDMLRIKQEEQKLLATMHESLSNAETQRLKADAEVLSHKIDAGLKHEDQKHRHAKEVLEMHHKINQPKMHPRYFNE